MSSPVPPALTPDSRLPQANGSEAPLSLALLQEKAERYQVMFSTASEGILVHTLDGKALELNEAFARMHGYTQAEMLAMNLRDLNVPGGFRKHPERIARFLAGEALTFEGEPVHKDGHVIAMDVLVSLVSGGDMPVLLAFHRDISQRRKDEAEKAELQAQLVHAQKMESLGSLAGGVAHDMNNVLGAILGLASIHMETQPPGSSVHRAFGTIIQASERGGTMLKSLLRFARQSPAECLELNLNALIHEEVRLLERTTLSRVRLVRELAPNLRPMLGDANALSHAIMNLCVNAVDAMPENGTLTLRTRNHGADQVEVEVEDTGSGMSKEVLAKALDPFFTTKESGKGTGLGLSIVYSTVKSHQGQMQLHSEPGQGTRISLRFPACLEAPSQPAQAESGPERVTHRPLHVLLVDDDELVQNSLQMMLQALGHEVALATCGEEALGWLGEGTAPDLVILDLNMPGLGGPGTLVGIRSLHPDLPVLLSTGRTDQMALDLVEAHPRVSLLPKPFTMKVLREQLGQFQGE